MEDKSKLHLYSYGIVAANKSLKSNNIQVTPIEKLQMTDGELTDNLTTANTSVVDADGASTDTTTYQSATLTARWLPFSSNRKTSPDVRRGEKVCIWKFADADKYYWSELEYEGKFRKLETVIYAFSATMNEGDDEAADTTYFFEISTHNKQVRFHTSMANSEPYSYDFLLNTGEGQFQFMDNIENIFFLDSAAKQWVLKNAEGSFINLNGKDLQINVVGDFTTKVGGNYSLIVDGDYATKTPKATFVTPQLLTTEEFQCGKNATVGMNLILGMGMQSGVSGGAGSGDIQLNGSVRANGGAEFSETVQASHFVGDGSGLTNVPH